MFKTTQTFTFSVNSKGETQSFAGTLKFSGESLNTIGSLHTLEDLESFGELLNKSLYVPEEWSLETLSQLMYVYAKPIFNNLTSVSISLEKQPERVSEFIGDAVFDSALISEEENDILELEAIV